MSAQRMTKILNARGIAGVIFHPFDEGSGQSGLPLEPASFALVMIEHVFVEPRLHKVCDDQFSTIGRMIQRLLDYGYTRIGIAMSSRADDHANHHWLAGYQAYEALNGPTTIPHLITTEWTKERLLAWYRYHRPEVIITIDDDTVGWLRDAGLRVPQDVACATLYWKEDRAFLSGFYQNHEHIGAAAVDLVVSHLNHNERGLPAEQRTMLIESVWKEGTTLPRRTAPNTRSHLRVWTR